MSDIRDSELLTGREIAVIGMAGRFPGARNLQEYYRNLQMGVDSISSLTDEELLQAGVSSEVLSDSNYVKKASLLDDVELFDASFFGFTAREAEILDPQQRLFLETTWHALENSGYAPMEYDGLIGMYAGVAWNTYLLSNLVSHQELFERGGGFQVFITNDKDFMPTRVAYKFNLKGPAVIIQTSCSTSLTAIHMACLGLLNYECDIAMAGGGTVKVPQKSGYFYQEGGLASPDGVCRPFDADAAGTIFGSGVGVVVLKRLSEAIADGDDIRAIIKASAINNDGSSKVSYTAPSVEGQAQVIDSALSMAGVEAETIQYIETHGTGTFMGDPIEITALTKVFRRYTERNRFCAIGSVKSNIGHLDAAAGVAGFIKTVLSLENKEIFPSINYQTPNPAINFEETPFYVSTKSAYWDSGEGPRRAAVSSFGVGGTNAHLILEEAPERVFSKSSRLQQLLLVSAKTKSALNSSIKNLSALIKENENLSLPNLSYTLQTGREVFSYRCALVCSSREDAIQSLEAKNSPSLILTYDQKELRDCPIVFMFPGQSSQYISMGKELYEQEPVFRDQINYCAEVLKPILKEDIRDLVFPIDDVDQDHHASRLTQTSFAQPVLFAFEYSLAVLWIRWGIRPSAMIGHSIGEYVAACLSGVFSLEDGLALAAIRGRLMQQQPPGSMLAVTLSEQEIQSLLPKDLCVAAINESSRVVISGSSDSIAKFEDTLSKYQIDFHQLHTSHAFHSEMMEPVLSPFIQHLSTIQLNPPSIPYISNLTGEWITPEQAVDPMYWANHLRKTVHFATGIQKLLIDSDRVFLEVGPSRTLTTLVKHISEGRERIILSSMRHPKESGSDQALMLESLGRLWVAGVKINWKEFYEYEKRQRIQAPEYPFDRSRFWIEPKKHSIDKRTTTVLPVDRSVKADIADWFYLPSWKTLPYLLSPVIDGENRYCWLVLSSGGRYAESLISRLQQLDQEVVIVEIGSSYSHNADNKYVIRPDCPEDYKSLLKDLLKSNLAPQIIVHAISMSGKQQVNSEPEKISSSHKKYFHSLLFLLQAVTQENIHNYKLTVLSNGVFSNTGTKPLYVDKVSMLGLCRAVEQESNNLITQFIDFYPDNSQSSLKTTYMIDSLIADMDGRSNESIVAYLGGRRLVPNYEPFHYTDTKAGNPFCQQGTYIVIGGTTPQGIKIAEYLVRTVNANILLVDDLLQNASDDVISNKHKNISESLKRLGGGIRHVEIDTADVDELQRLWSKTESEFGKVCGVVFSVETAGESSFRLISEITLEDSERLLWRNASVLYALETLLEDKQLDFCVLLSSLASILGGIGSGLYSSLDLLIDSFVLRGNKTTRTPWISLSLDLWLNDSNDDRITETRKDLSERAMTVAEGEEVFRRALMLKGIDQLYVSTMDLSKSIVDMKQRLDLLRNRHTNNTIEETEIALHPRPALTTPYVVPSTELERRITTVWQRILGFEPIGIEDNFFDLGGDSLIAIKMTSVLKQELKIDFPVAKIYQGVTIKALAHLLEQDQNPDHQHRVEQLAAHQQIVNRRNEYIERRSQNLPGKHN